MHELFADRGWDVIACRTTEEVSSALLSRGAGQPDVVILDLHLRERAAGLRILQALKAHAHTRDIPVILCSGDMWALQSLPESVRAALAAVLVKPFDINQAYQCVEFVLGQRASQSKVASDAVGNS
jgi:DNA-binding NtrC family response regulator